MLRSCVLRFSTLLVSLLLVAPARADDAAAKLRAIADRFAKDGDQEAAREALEKAKATPEALLKAVRASGATEPYVAGQSKLPLEDAHGGKTDLFVDAPSESDAKASLKEGGLTTILSLHGLGGDGVQIRDVVKRIAPKGGKVLILAPSAQRVPKDLQNDDVPFFDAGAPHWWIYRSAHSFPLEALRLARHRWPIDTDRVILMGYSMGGFGTWNLGLRFADRFAGIAPCAGGLSRREFLVEKDPGARRLLVNARDLFPWFTHGDADTTVPVSLSRKLHAALDELEIEHRYEEVKGESHILPIARGGGNAGSLREWIDQRHRKSAPQKVEHVSIGDYQDGAYWLRVGKRSKTDGVVTLRGKVDKAKNAVEVEVEGPASSVDVYLDDRLLDLTKPVTVNVKGQEPVREKVKAETDAILESWRAREDPKLVYPARVRVEIKRTFR